MHDPQNIWRLGEWFASKSNGSARLSWAGGTMTLQLAGGRIVGATGLDPAEVSRRLETGSLDHSDLLEEARALAAGGDIAEPQAIGAAKEVIQHALMEWLDDGARELDIHEHEAESTEGSSISVTHAIVEMVLSAAAPDLADKILPDTDSVLRRTPDFLDLYGPLRLSEEADLIVAKISGERTAKEISERSPHGHQETMRLLCALIATGMIQAIPPEPAPELEPEPTPPPVEEIPIITPDRPDYRAEFEIDETPKKVPIAWFAVAFVVLAVVLGALGMWLKKAPPEQTPEVVASGPQWGLVVDMGCAPDDFRRILKATHAHPTTTQPVAIGEDDGEPCWQLAWGIFDSQAKAEEAISDIPSTLKRSGFSPHAIELPDEPAPLDELELAGN